SDWDCTVERDGAIRLGLRYVSGLRQEVGKKIGFRLQAPGFGKASGSRLQTSGGLRCPKCGCDDQSMIEPVARAEARSLTPEAYFCNNCSHDWAAFAPNASAPTVPVQRPRRYGSLDELIARTGLRRDEVVTLADIGALNSFCYDRRAALWQAERAVRPSGELFTELAAEHAELAEISLDQMDSADSASSAADSAPTPESRVPSPEPPPSLDGAETELRRDRPQSLSPDPQPLAPNPEPLAP